MISFYISRKLRRGRKKNGMVSFVSIISTFSIALGIAALIIGLSTMNGFERELKDRILSLIPHGQVKSFSHEPIQDWQSIEQQLMQSKHVTETSPLVEFSGLIEKNSTLKPVQIEGVNPKQEFQFGGMRHYVDEKEWFRLSVKSNEIMLGDGLADMLSVKKGDAITLLIPNKDGLKKPIRIRLTVAGIIHFQGQFGNYLAYISLKQAQGYLSLNHTINALKFNVDDSYKINQIINEIEIVSEDDIYLSSWMSQDNRQLFKIYNDINMVRTVMYIAMIVVIAVACFSIVSSLVIAVQDKRREIAIFKTIGASNSLIYAIFIWYGLISGVIGCLIGLILGVFISLNLTTIFNVIEHIMGRKLLNSDIYFINFIPSELHIMDILTVAGITFVLTLIASLYPAYRATRIAPIKIISQ